MFIMVIIESTEIRFNEVLIIDYKKAGQYDLLFSYPEPGSNRHSLAATGV